MPSLRVMGFSVIIPAAGSGSRMGAAIPKVLLPIGSNTSEPNSILRRTVAIFQDRADCSQIIVCAPATWHERFIFELGSSSKLQVVIGGATRQESVLIGVEALSITLGLSDDSVVLVHDAARCCLSHELIDRVLEGVKAHGAVTSAVRVVDALCCVDDMLITGHADRTKLWAVQTPQGFLLKDLKVAHEEARINKITALDDAELVAKIRPVRVVEGDKLNIKLTEPVDLRIAARVL